jgi:anti-sigma regulatory factor (Ser/Thr protein kinase)
VTTRSLTAAAELPSLGAVREFVRTGAMEADLPDAHVNELDLVMEEAIVNICRYAYPEGKPGMVTVTYSIPAQGRLSVEIADQGIEFNPLSAAPPDLTVNLGERPIGGLGIFLLKTLAPSLTWRREDGWNRLTVGVSAAA